MYSSDEEDDEWFDTESGSNQPTSSKSPPRDPSKSGSSYVATSSQPITTVSKKHKNGAVPASSSVPIATTLAATPTTRTQLPMVMMSRKDFSVWTFLKQCIGKELSKITMPVIFNEPLSFLQRMAEYMEYGQLLHRAAACTDPVLRMEYVAAFALSSSASNWDRVGKPFNPLLGETYELTRDDLGFRMVSEQVSHHPPVSAFHVDSPQYTFHGCIHPKLKFWGKSIEVTPKGVLTLTFHEHNEVYTWSNIICCVHNIIVGKLWIEHYGTMEITNHRTGHRAVLNFKPSGWFGKDLHKVEGYLYDGSKKKVRAFYGKWVDSLYSHDVKSYEKWKDSSGKSDSPMPEFGSSSSESIPVTSGQNVADELPAVRLSTCDLQLYDERLLWKANPRPADSDKYYNFTKFALSLNELRPANVRDIVSPTDSRLRPDIRKLEEGDLDGASAEKHRIEEKQRATRKARKDAHEKWKPVWFSLDTNPYSKKDDWLFTGEYWKKKWDKSPNIF